MPREVTLAPEVRAQLSVYPFEGARRLGVHAFVGPCISFEGYQVGPEVAASFAHVRGALRADGGDRSRLDLRRVAVHELSTNGVFDDHIEVCAQSTDGGETFFSDRAARPCGRFALVAKRAVA